MVRPACKHMALLALPQSCLRAESHALIGWVFPRYLSHLAISHVSLLINEAQERAMEVGGGSMQVIDG